MNTIDQAHVITELVNKYATQLPRLDAETFYRYQYDSEKLMLCANFYDDLIDSSINFADTIQTLSGENGANQVLQLFLLQAMACLHADEHQVKRVLQVRQSLFESRVNLKKVRIDKTLELSKINLNYVKTQPDALKALQYIFPQPIDSWLNLVITKDDPDLATSLLDMPGNIISSSQLKSQIGDNPNIRKMIYGTSNRRIKDLYTAYSYAFSSEFKENTFNQLMSDYFDPQLLKDNAEYILAQCFLKLTPTGLMGDPPEAQQGQEKAVATVINALKDAGADWYKSWCASREPNYVPALIDLQNDTFTEKERLSGYFTDDRIYNLQSGSIQEAVRRVMTQSFSPDAMCSVFAGRYDSDDLFKFFHQQTQNPIFLAMIKSNQAKREILTDGLGL